MPRVRLQPQESCCPDVPCSSQGAPVPGYWHYTPILVYKYPGDAQTYPAGPKSKACLTSSEPDLCLLAGSQPALHCNMAMAIESIPAPGQRQFKAGLCLQALNRTCKKHMADVWSLQLCSAHPTKSHHSTNSTWDHPNMHPPSQQADCRTWHSSCPHIPPVDDSLVLCQPEDSGLGVPFLGLRRDSPHFHKAKAHLVQPVHSLTLLVEASSQAHWVAESLPKDSHLLRGWG